MEPTPQEHDIAEAANERQIRATQKIFQFSMTQLSQGAGGGVKRQQEQGPRQFMSKARFQGMLTECSKQQIYMSYQFSSFSINIPLSLGSQRTQSSGSQSYSQMAIARRRASRKEQSSAARHKKVQLVRTYRYLW